MFWIERSEWFEGVVVVVRLVFCVLDLVVWWCLRLEVFLADASDCDLNEICLDCGSFNLYVNLSILFTFGN